MVGRRVQFVKRYLGRGQAAIDYIGTVSEDGDYITGQWSIGGFDAGPWEAHRSEDDLSASWQALLQQNLTPTLI